MKMEMLDARNSAEAMGRGSMWEDEEDENPNWSQVKLAWQPAL